MLYSLDGDEVFVLQKISDNINKDTNEEITKRYEEFKSIRERMKTIINLFLQEVQISKNVQLCEAMYGNSPQSWTLKNTN